MFGVNAARLESVGPTLGRLVVQEEVVPAPLLFRVLKEETGG